MEPPDLDRFQTRGVNHPEQGGAADAPIREVEVQYGNRSRAQAAFDASGPLAGNENVFYCLTGLARSVDTEFISAPDDRLHLAPALTLRSDDRRTNLTILGKCSVIGTLRYRF